MKLRVRQIIFGISFVFFSASVLAQSCGDFYSGEVTRPVAMRQISNGYLNMIKLPTTQVSVVSEFTIRNLKLMSGYDQVNPEKIAETVASFDHRVNKSKINEAVTNDFNEKLEAIREKVKRLKDKSVPAMVFGKVKKEAYLSQLAVEIKNDFALINKDSTVLKELGKPFEEIAKEIGPVAAETQLAIKNVEMYIAELNYMIHQAQTLMHRSAGEIPADRMGLVLNSLLLESNQAESTLTILKASLGSLNSFAMIANSSNTLYKDGTRVNMAAFLLESGFSPSFIENEITERAKNAALALAAVQKKKADRDAFKNRIVNKAKDTVNKVKRNKVKFVLATATAATLTAGGLNFDTIKEQYQAREAEHARQELALEQQLKQQAIENAKLTRTMTEQIAKKNPNIIRIMNLAKQASFNEANSMIFDKAKEYSAVLTVDEFVYYISHGGGQSGRDTAIENYMDMKAKILTADEALRLVKLAGHNSTQSALVTFAKSRVLTQAELDRIVPSLSHNNTQDVLRWYSEKLK
jgi:hypothetical protein